MRLRIASIHVDARISDARKNFLIKKYGVNLSIIEIAEYFANYRDDYLEWVIKNFKKFINVPPDIIAEEYGVEREREVPELADLRDNLETFTKLKNSPNFKQSKDINSYSVEKLRELVTNEHKEYLSEKEKVRRLIQKESEIILNDEDLVVYRALTPKALSLLSYGTDWCTLNIETAENYLKKNDVYIGYYKKKPYIIYDVISEQLMDSDNIPFHSPGKLLDENSPELEKFVKLLNSLGLAKEFKFTEDLETLKKILSSRDSEEKAKELVAYVKGTEKQSLEIEAEFIRLIKKGYSSAIESALQYAMLMYFGYRWPEMEPIFIANHAPGVTTDTYSSLGYSYGVLYAKNVIKGRWKELEDYILEKENYNDGIDYALMVLKRKRWPELEKALLKYKIPASSYMTRYANLILRDRWPEAEKYIILSGGTAIAYYARTVIKGRWPEAEESLLKHKFNEHGIYEYAKKVIKAPWPEAEPILLRSADSYSIYYARDFLKTRWPELEAKLVKNDKLNELADYIAQVAKKTWPEAEKAVKRTINKFIQKYKFRKHVIGPSLTKAIMQIVNLSQHRWEDIESWIANLERQDLLIQYTRLCTKGRWDAYEKRLLKDGSDATDYCLAIKNRWPEYEQSLVIGRQHFNTFLNKDSLDDGLFIKICDYAKFIIKGRWQEKESILMKNAQYATKYAKEVIKDRWPELDAYLKANPKQQKNYSEYLEYTDRLSKVKSKRIP